MKRGCKPLIVTYQTIHPQIAGPAALSCSLSVHLSLQFPSFVCVLWDPVLPPLVSLTLLRAAAPSLQRVCVLQV